jgi:hypothetical protein
MIDAWDLLIKEGDIVVVKAERSPGLSVYERTFVCNGRGFGAYPKAMGSAVFGKWLDGSRGRRIERFNISKLETLAFREGVAYASALVLQDRKEAGNAKV